MENFITTLVSVSSDNRSWNSNTGKLMQLFTFLTGYDIMFEESRKDMAPVNNAAVTQTSHVLTNSLFDSIKKNLRPRMM